MNKCPKCGGTYFYRSYQVHGQWTELTVIDENGFRVEESYTDNIKYGKEPKTIKCADCGKRVPNPDYE
jgi:predicted RNA-binding Zn-ribbon protein involved in translation (DUF1610 family)